jgi:outer membrane murein-binding lipoprotein Lpp
MKWLILFLLVPGLAWSQEYQRLDRIESQLRSLNGRVQDAIDQREFQAGQQRLTDQANQSAREGQAAAQATQRANEAAQQQMQGQRR